MFINKAWWVGPLHVLNLKICGLPWELEVLLSTLEVRTLVSQMEELRGGNK